MKETCAALWKGLGRRLVELLCPEHAGCLCCDRGLGEADEGGLCSACARALDALEAMQAQNACAAPEDGITAVHCAYPYTGEARRLVIRLKYKGVRRAAEPLAKAMAMLPLGEAELLVPVPTTKRREKARGYNQAAVLCAGLSRETGMPMACALTRTAERTAQTGLTGALRRKNLEGTMTADARAAGRKILLVDDVYTTGATAREAARALREAGALEVFVVTAARSVKSGRKKSAVSRSVNGNKRTGF